MVHHHTPEGIRFTLLKESVERLHANFTSGGAEEHDGTVWKNFREEGILAGGFK